jgi:hypothetical protein
MNPELSFGCYDLWVRDLYSILIINTKVKVFDLGENLVFALVKSSVVKYEWSTPYIYPYFINALFLYTIQDKFILRAIFTLPVT